MGSASWQIVGYPDDPIPDNAGVVSAQVEHLRSVAATIGTQVASLPQSGQVDGLVWRSENNDAPSQFRQMAAQLPHDLDLLRTRYVKVASALDDLHPTLVRTQAQARTNLTVALSAYQDIQNAQAGVSQMDDFQSQAQVAAQNQNRNLPAGQAPAQPAPWTGPDYPAMLTDAQTRFNHAKSQIDIAVGQFNSASQTAADRVNSASNDGLKNKHHSWFSTALSWVDGQAEDQWVWNHRETVFHALSTAWRDTDNAFQKIDPILKIVAEVSGDLSAVAALLALVPIPGVDVVADAVSEVAGVVDASADGVILLTDHNAADRKWARSDVKWALLGIVTAGAARGLGKGASILKGAREADEAVDAAKAAKVAKEDEFVTAGDKVVSAFRRKGISELDAFSQETRAEGLTGEGAEMAENIANVKKGFAKEADEAYQSAMKDFVAKGAAADKASASVEKAEAAAAKFTKVENAKGIAQRVTGFGVKKAISFEKANGADAWLDLDAIHEGNLKEFGWGAAGTLVSVGSNAAIVTNTVKGLNDQAAGG